MESRIPRGSEPSGTSWTPAMESYFIGLLLDQVHRGNRMGYTFNEQAWNEMLALFNANFGSSYGVNLLKSRYTSLWMQFNDIKNLLEQNGFSWDESRQMVIASDHVWDAYIKAHPHAQAYRSTAPVNIKDLCLIYAHKSADGRYSLSSHDMVFADDDQVVKAGTGVSVRNPDPVTRTDWTVAMDCYFVKLMLEQLKNGNRIRNTFCGKAWNHMLKFFNKKFDAQYDKSFLKNRYDKLENYYTDVKSLLDLKDFSWDENQQRIVADDYVWENYIKVHPHASSYRNKTLVNYRDLGSIYDNAMCNAHCNFMQEGRCSRSCSEDHISNGPILTMGVDKDTQDCALGDYSMTDWTPSMTRYLVDLMLEEVRKRNRINYVLNNQAWSEMTVLLKERFGTQFDKDYLKNCCKGLENIYQDLRSLLDQKGFSWDETQQMITAYDGVWDVYIKEHPYANYYRNHRKPNYNDLCLIYGNSETKLTCNLANQNFGYKDYSTKFQNFHWRSDWTPPMDRYFMDLMLQEVRNGSMVNHKFDRLTWRDIVVKFSAEFGSQYDKDVLKGRHVTLRKRFNDMKILINQSGFAWDEIQQMITADERLWDAYVNAHPDMNAYRNRTLPNFNDLFLIYGNTSCGRNSNYSDCYRASKDNELDVWEYRYSHSLADDEPMRIAWTVKMNHYLIGLLLEQLNRGNKIGDTFSKKAWSRMTASFKREFGLLCDRDALENRYFGLMRVYKDVTYLLNQNDFAWDEIGQTSRANDIWQAYFEEYPDAVTFGETLRDNYSDLCLLFGNLNQNRKLGRVRMKLKTNNNNNNNLGMESNEIIGNLQSSAREFKTADGRRKRKSQAVLTSSNGRKIQKFVLGEMQEDFEEKKDNSIECIVAALQTVPDLDDELFLEACLLLEDERKARMFVAMDASARKRWLLKKLQR
ncbi:uncharacterized protein LOC113870933 isoform X2 [Abrus precatorius]|uniref:Uncharacterized protein LOC113870933 isoform X2 n=1 Tax=Abrus precatorius TaxID=3816 RepID=A0A8B8M468_ABRPR|nr:uncharacterized protein LOC113870933 isoform X2 [Abrus precatorius]